MAQSENPYQERALVNVHDCRDRAAPLRDRVAW